MDTSIQKHNTKRTLKTFLFYGFVVLLLLFLIHKHVFKTPTKKAPFPVVVSEVYQKTIPLTLPAIGNVTATYTITVVTQINGLLMKVLYKEGQFVKKGDLLAEIDQRPLLAQLTQYEGQLTRDEALLANALIDLKRYQRLWKQDSISQQTLATQESLVKQYRGDVLIDKGLIELTKVNLIYCHITSPMDGRIGLRLVDPGNFVQTTNTSGLFVINSLNPITVIFTLPEDNITQIRPFITDNKTITVKAYDRQQNRLLDTGTLLATDNQVDISTGTLRLRSQFPNKNNRLFPNQFVNIKLFVGELKNATLVSTAAIQHASQHDFVYLLQSDKTVRVQNVSTGITLGNATVIKKGLSPHQKVVVDGADKLSNGALVTLMQAK